MSKSQVAETILHQLGGNRFLVMTGARNLVYDRTSLTFKVGRNSKSVTHCRIVLDPSDTYTVEFLWVRGHHVKTRGTHEGVYCDQLVEIFERGTGLATRL